jgi:hypothetical protein
MRSALTCCASASSPADIAGTSDKPAHAQTQLNFMACTFGKNGGRMAELYLKNDNLDEYSECARKHIVPVKKPTPVVYTIGHSTRSLEELVAILRAHGVKRVVDVRTIPRSRRNPQFNRESLGKTLHNRRLNYRHMKALGGLRRPRPDSVNTGWRNSSFRGFADYMQTEAFAQALARLLRLARQKPTAIMCAEAVPWRCHRSLIADALVARGHEVRDIMSATNARAHVLTSMAVVRGQQVTYPPMTVNA